MKERRLTIPALLKLKKAGEKISMITAYDYPSACMVEEAGIDVVLVGDSLGMVVLGYENTLSVTMDEMIHHTRAVQRGLKNAVLVGDMPFLSVKVNLSDSIINAGRFIKEAGAHAVKIEGGMEARETIRAIINAQIPVMGHIGLTPQSINSFGGYKVQGKTIKAARYLIESALALEEDGIFAIVLEGIPWEISKIITKKLTIPTIGIGAGQYCDGQVLVFHDLLGFYSEFSPRFLKRYADLRPQIIHAVTAYIQDVKQNKFPEEKHSYTLEDLSILEIL
ncbi:MAG: 3-methyl-2-oxobutanoate hydroxymethyltransferase, partial [Candidatus Schekmanbacteria bacterium RBG_13_48_7]